ncbi:hypothetical protein BC834DRAFT_802224, partial [Gloeopeniophorella convolvens]
LSSDDAQAIRVHNLKVDINLGTRSYDRLRRAFPSLSNLHSVYRLQCRIASLSGIQPKLFDCCINSCCCFTGDLSREQQCPYCSEPRLGTNNQPRRQFSYLPIIPRLVSFFHNKNLAEKMQYRAKYPSGNGPLEDVFDGAHYRRLRQVHVTIGSETLPHKFFSHPTDIAIGLSTDGFCPFKRRKQTC